MGHGFAVALVAAWSFVPIAVMLWASLMPLSALIGRGLIQWPGGMGFTNYRALLGFASINEVFGGQAMAVARGFFNSIVVAIAVAVIGTAVAVIGGYAFGRFRFPFKNTLLFVLLSVRVLPPIAILIPYFVILSALHLIGTYASLIVTYLTAVVPLLTWVLMGYFASLAPEIERAARIDGCGRLRALWHVTVPMATPGIAARSNRARAPCHARSARSAMSCSSAASPRRSTPTCCWRSSGTGCSFRSTSSGVAT